VVLLAVLKAILVDLFQRKQRFLTLRPSRRWAVAVGVPVILLLALCLSTLLNRSEKSTFAKLKLELVTEPGWSNWGTEPWLTSLAFSPDGKSVAAVGGRSASTICGIFSRWQNAGPRRWRLRKGRSRHPRAAQFGKDGFNSEGCQRGRALDFWLGVLARRQGFDPDMLILDV
jgi:hypothetical protein